MRNNGSSENLSNSKGAEIVCEQIIPFLCGRPERTSSIDHDDYINLQIALYTCKSLEEFLDVI